MSLKSLQNAFHNFINWVEQLGHDGADEAMKIAKAASLYVEENGGKFLRDAATAGVVAAQANGGSGKEKFEAAFAAITAALVAQGIPLVKSAINLAIEMALADAKSAGLINA